MYRTVAREANLGGALDLVPAVNQAASIMENNCIRVDWAVNQAAFIMENNGRLVVTNPSLVHSRFIKRWLS